MTTAPLVRQLLEAGVHFGHQTKRWNPKMKRFIFGSRAGIYIIDLEKTEAALQRACTFIQEVAAKGHQVLLVGTKKQAKAIVEAAAVHSGMPYVTSRWLGGTLTNFETIKRNIDLLSTLRTQHAEGYFERVSKKDAKQLQRQLAKLEERFSGLATMNRLPACLYIVDPKRELIAVREGNRCNIPIVAICDTNADPDMISYPIPGNDDAIRAIKLITFMVADRVLEGRTSAGLPTGSEAAVAAVPGESAASPEGEVPAETVVSPSTGESDSTEPAETALPPSAGESDSTEPAETALPPSAGEPGAGASLEPPPNNHEPEGQPQAQNESLG